MSDPGVIQLRVTGTKVEATGAASTDIPFPVTRKGDILIATLSAATANLPTNPGGWTQICNFSATGNTLLPFLWAGLKIADGTESGVLTIAHTSAVRAAQMYAFSGVDQLTPQDVAAQTMDLASSASPGTFTGITLTRKGVMLVYIATGSAAANTYTPDTGFTEVTDSAGTKSLETCYRADRPSGATGTITATQSGTQRRMGVLLALRPAAPQTFMVAA